MFTLLLRVEHGRCSLCGSKEPLFMVDLTAGTRAAVKPLPNKTHAGACRRCLLELGAVLAEGDW